MTTLCQSYTIILVAILISMVCNQAIELSSNELIQNELVTGSNFNDTPNKESECKEIERHVQWLRNHGYETINRSMLYHQDHSVHRLKCHTTRKYPVHQIRQFAGSAMKWMHQPQDQNDTRKSTIDMIKDSVHS